MKKIVHDSEAENEHELDFDFNNELEKNIDVLFTTADNYELFSKEVTSLHHFIINNYTILENFNSDTITKKLVSIFPFFDNIVYY